MIGPSQLNVLDLKNSKLGSSPKEASKKSGKAFGDELIEKQRKLKKREDDDVASGQKADVKRDDAAESNKSSEANGGRRATAPIQDSQTQKTNGLQNTAEPAPVETQDAESVVVDETALQAENALQALSKQVEGKISLEGFQMMKPQIMSPEIMQNNAMTTNAEDAMAALSIVTETPGGGKEQMMQDFMSKNSEGEGLPTFDLSADGLNTLTAPKETPQTTFANIMKAQEALNTDGAKQTNVDNIVSQARAILKDGGGEMQVVLTPEGLGKVDLKVGVEKGQVTIEILAQDNNVKKMFEDSIYEIRGALENQNLKVDTFKVGVSENFDNSQQMSQGQMDMMNREFARDFLGQFRDERNSFRAQSLNTMQDAAPLAKNQPEGLSPAQRSSVPGSGRLNVVA